MMSQTIHAAKKWQYRSSCDVRIFMLTETTTLLENETVKISVSDDELSTFSYEKNVKAKVVPADL